MAFDFEDAVRIWDGSQLEVRSSRKGEERILAIDLLQDTAITVVFTWRGEKRRLISARIARRNERADYRQKIGRQT
jgi:uncharacterized DUF497 family protein